MDKALIFYVINKGSIPLKRFGRKSKYSLTPKLFYLFFLGFSVRVEAHKIRSKMAF